MMDELLFHWFFGVTKVAALHTASMKGIIAALRRTEPTEADHHWREVLQLHPGAHHHPWLPVLPDSRRDVVKVFHRDLHARALAVAARTEVLVVVAATPH